MRKFDEVREWFVQKLGDESARKTLKRAVFLFSFGSKEYLSLYFSGRNDGSKSSQKKYAEMVVGNITDAFLVRLCLHSKFDTSSHILLRSC